jgi:hypothetical protein
MFPETRDRSSESPNGISGHEGPVGRLLREPQKKKTPPLARVTAKTLLWVESVEMSRSSDKQTATSRKSFLFHFALQDLHILSMTVKGRLTYTKQLKAVQFISHSLTQFSLFSLRFASLKQTPP